MSGETGVLERESGKSRVKISGWKWNGILRRMSYENHESVSGHFGNQLS